MVLFGADDVFLAAVWRRVVSIADLEREMVFRLREEESEVVAAVAAAGAEVSLTLVLREEVRVSSSSSSSSESTTSSSSSESMSESSSNTIMSSSDSSLSDKAPPREMRVKGIRRCGFCCCCVNDAHNDVDGATAVAHEIK